jgi:4-alpha-glucanotransferase
MSGAVSAETSAPEFIGRKSISPLAGKPAQKEQLVDGARLERDYFERRPDTRDPNEMVSFGASGHRGSPLNGTFTESHILAITHALCDFRNTRGVDGSLYMGKDTHALSAVRTAPFPSHYRASGILLHITSLPSPYGIGDMGPTAFAWVDQLQEAEQSWWQILPSSPTGYGDSPYQALSSFAANGLLISPELLIAEGLLDASACAGQSFPSSFVDYDAVSQFKMRLLDQVYVKFRAGVRADLRVPYENFCHQQAHWLDDYALFRALKQKYRGLPYLSWPSELIRRSSGAMTQAREELWEQIDRICLAQFLTFRQSRQLKEYAHSKGIRLIGDLPFFVSPDSSDLWAHPDLFVLGEKFGPSFVAGVPPDSFCAEGQLWGNPVYDWDALHRREFRFCIERVQALLMHVDVVRLDHFRAFAAAWHVAAGATTARVGKWEPGPGAAIFHGFRKQLGGLPFIAEDLGLITPDVSSLRDEFHIPGTRVLQFAFDGSRTNPHLPENFSANTVMYTGTHDNNTTRGWFEALPELDRRRVSNHLHRGGQDSSQVVEDLLRMAWSSLAALAIAPLQDVLNLGAEARMNVPGSSEGNWRWRATEGMLRPSAFEQLRELTIASNRSRRFQHELATRGATAATLQEDRQPPCSSEGSHDYESDSTAPQSGTEHLARQHHPGTTR